MSGSAESRWLEWVEGGGGLVGAAARLALGPLGVVYGAGALAYRRSYELGLRRRREAALPLVSVGALSVGGAGKTTVATYLAGQSLAQGKRPALVLRGYRRQGDDDVAVVSDGEAVKLDARRGGDEAVLLARRCPGAVVVVGKRREKAIERARDLGADMAILDDGFQYFRLRREEDHVLVSALQAGRKNRVFPAGVLREPPRVLSRATTIWVTYARSAGVEVVESVQHWCERYAPGVPQVLADYRVAACRRRSDGAPAEAKGAIVAAFCGIGSPEGFRRSVEDLEPRSAEMMIFPDHHWYDEGDLRALASWARGLGADLVLTTAKDAVRLEAGQWPGDAPPLAVVEVEIEILGGEAPVAERERRG
jgi:tetraacyldisaccharide 4'-kinase